jgi:hypothetical protein
VTETTAWLPPQIQRRMVLNGADEIRPEKDLKAEEAQRAERAFNTAMTVYLEAANARGEYPSPMQLAAAALPATDEERDRRLQEALEFSLNGHRAQWLAEWEKLQALAKVQAELGAIVGQDGEKAHVEVAEPVIFSPPVKRTIASRSRHWQAWREKVAAAEAARRAVEADRDLGLVGDVVVRRGR